MDLPIDWLPERGAPEQLILLLHGWSQRGDSLLPLARALRSAFPQAAVLAPSAPQLQDVAADAAAAAAPAADATASPGPAAVDVARPRQWYSVQGLTPANWPGRVADALPPLLQWVQAQQQRLGVAPAATCLGGFSQGAILALALAMQHDGIAGRVLAFGGCLTSPPEAAPRHSTLHLFHGADDQVIPADGSRQALAWLGELQGDATLDIAQGVGHVLHPALVDCALHRLRSHIPLRTWQAALGVVPAR